jgi:hypothetical protein
MTELAQSAIFIGRNKHYGSKETAHE